MPNPYKAIAIGCMIWTFLGGIVALLAIRGMQIAAGSGAVGPFPMVLIGYVVAVSVLLYIPFVGFLRRRSWAPTTLWIVLAAVPISTVIGIRLGDWARDFLPNALILEAVWLGPWVLLMTKQPQKPSLD